MHFRTKGIFSRPFDTEAEALAAADGAADTVLVELTLQEYKDLVQQTRQERAAAADLKVENVTLDKKVAELDKDLADERAAGQEAARQVKYLKRNVENLQQAVRRWRFKTGVDEPTLGDPVLLKTELVRRREELLYYEYYLLPTVEKNPVLIRPAAQIVHDQNWTNRLERLHFTKRGWVAVIRAAW